MATRAFLALDLSPAAVKAITRLQESTERAHSGLYRWTEADNLHLTLYFLGNLEEDQLDQIKRAAFAFPAFELSLGKILTLPEPTVPKILAVGLIGELPQLKKLQQQIHDRVFSLAENKETRPFVPHITFGRLKKGVPPSAKAVKRLVGSLSPLPALPWKVESIRLVASHLSKEGPTYETLVTYPAQL